MDRKLFEEDFVLDESSTDMGYCFYREDDYSSTAYFYYDKPSSELPVLPSCGERVKDLRI
jgi:hypothetical protein